MDRGAWWAAVHGALRVRHNWATSLSLSLSVYSCHLFLYLLLLLGPYHFCPSLCPSLHEMFPWYLIFLKKSLVFPILLFPSISLHWSLRKAFYLFLLFFGTLHSNAYIFPFLHCFSLLFYTAICKASSDSHFAFLHFFSLGMVLIPVQWHCTFLYNVTNLPNALKYDCWAV